MSNFKTSQEAFNHILRDVSSRYGSPMGRYSDNYERDRPTDRRIYNRGVRLDCGAYDKGGAYWGFPSNLRVEYTKDCGYIHFYRTY